MAKKEIKKEWFLDRYCNQQFAALLEDGKLTEFSCEHEPRLSCAGNIYKGKVVNVLSGMNAAFVNCGLQRNCYLSMGETYADCSKYDGAPQASSPLDVKEGDEILVQVVKPPRGNKGAKVTTSLSFVGKVAIYLPDASFLGLSRKITDEKTQERLLSWAEKLRERENEGFILRTQAPFATFKTIKRETAYLKKLYEEMLALAKDAPVGALLYEDDDLPARVMRDCYGEEIAAIRVGDDALYERVGKLAKLRGDIPEKKIHLYTGKRTMFKSYGITPLLEGLVQPVVPLDNGSSLVIEHTEAMTVIDVNTGSYVGEKNLEETVFAVNLAAAKEIARQVRLRNIGGIIVVDFIDMADETHKQAVTNTLTERLASDSARCNVLPMSELCITQFTRKRVGSNVLSYLEKPCPHCGGAGYVHEDFFVITSIRTEIMERFAEGYGSAIVELNHGIMRKILDEGVFSIELATRWQEKRIYFIPHKTYRESFFTVRGDDSPVLALPDNAQILY